MKARLWPLVMVLLLAGLLTSCNAVEAPDPDLENTSWHVLEINGSPLPEGIEITANFTDDVVGGEAPCNVYSAEYSQDGSQINIDAPIMTQMYCEEGNVMETEEAFTRALVAARQIALEGDNLFMQDADGKVVLLLERQPSG